MPAFIFKTEIDEQRAAATQDDAARAQSWAAGDEATLPLSRVKLAQLCALGERMQHANNERERAIGRMKLGGDRLAAHFSRPRDLDCDLTQLRQVVREHVHEVAQPRPSRWGARELAATQAA